MRPARALQYSLNATLPSNLRHCAAFDPLWKHVTLDMRSKRYYQGPRRHTQDQFRRQSAEREKS